VYGHRHTAANPSSSSPVSVSSSGRDIRNPHREKEKGRAHVMPSTFGGDSSIEGRADERGHIWKGRGGPWLQARARPGEGDPGSRPEPGRAREDRRRRDPGRRGEPDRPALYIVRYIYALRHIIVIRTKYMLSPSLPLVQKTGAIT